MRKIQLMTFYKSFRKELHTIERELERALQSNSPVVQKAALHLLQAGGKRIRPIFVILSAHFGERYDGENVAKVAVSLELIHMASLVHDDVIDHSDMRRGNPTVRAQYNNQVAMYTGDFIFSRALHAIGNIEKQQMHERLADTMLEICKGEIIQIDYQQVVNQNLRDYLRRIKRKTALLLSSSCELGAIVSEADMKTIGHMRRYGYFAGMAFQIVDDILDIVSTDEKLGKPAGSDLLNGHLTLPILHIKDDPQFVPYMKKAFAHTLSETERQEMLQYIRQSGAIEKSQALSDRYLEKALEEISHLPNNKAKKAFHQIAEFIGERKY